MAIVRAPGKFFRFNSSLKRCISLLRRGALGLRGLPCAGGGRVTPAGLAKLRFAGAIRLQKQSSSARWRKWIKQLTLFDPFPTPAVARGIFERTALRPRGPPLRRTGAPIGRSTGHPGEKHSLSARWCRSGLSVAICMSRAPGDSFYFAECEIVESLLRRGARGLRELASSRPGSAYAAGAVPPGTRYYLFSENFSPGRPGSSAERHPDEGLSKKRNSPLHLMQRAISFQIQPLFSLYNPAEKAYLYSPQALIFSSSRPIRQNATIKSLANRAFVINGILKSIADRRIV